jgi:ApbE superfamily uncharacterized protein (UPF0280 family)
MAARDAADARMTAMTARRTRYDDGRWHLQHGPIDLIIDANGDADAVRAAHEACWARFTGVLDELVRELPILRAPIAQDMRASDCPCEGAIARRMWIACHAHRARFITPMAAVAGSVADELIAAYAREGIVRAYINNGGDIAFHLAAHRALDAHYTIGVFADIARFDLAHAQAQAQGPGSDASPLDARLTLHAQQPVRGVATSGWRGRSFSLGIADSVTVLARDAASADAAATMIANAVDLDHPGIVRRPASSLKDDSDLGDRLVTVEVPLLPPPLVDLALERGAHEARRLCDAGIIEGAALFLQRRTRVVGAGVAEHACETVHQRFIRNAAPIDLTEAPCSRSAAC